MSNKKKTRSCSKCSKEFTVVGVDTMRICPTCNTKRVIGETQEVRMFRRAKSRARARGHTFSLNKTDIVIPKTCPILGVPLKHSTGKSGGKPNSPSLDRFDSQRGYESDNVWVISQRANAMKADASIDELKRFGEWTQTL